MDNDERFMRLVANERKAAEQRRRLKRACGLKPAMLPPVKPQQTGNFADQEMATDKDAPSADDA